MTLSVITFCVATLFVSVKVSAQVRSEEPAHIAPSVLFADELKKYRRMKTAGMILTGVGTAVVIIGLSMDNETGNPYGKSTDPGIDRGVGVAVLGLGLMGGVGIPLWIKGARRYKEYNNIQTSARALLLRPGHQGMTLVLKF